MIMLVMEIKAKGFLTNGGPRLWEKRPGARFSKAPILIGPGKLLLFEFKTDVSHVLQII